MQNITTTESVPQQKKANAFAGLNGPQAILKVLKLRGILQEDLAVVVGSSGAMSEMLSGKRTITMPMAIRLNRWLGIPVHVLRRCGAKA